MTEAHRTEDTKGATNLGKFPAFPLPISTALDGSIYSVADQSAGNDCGLTKRELLAAMALQGLMSGPMLQHRSAVDAAHDAVMYADCLLKELSK